MAAASEFQQTLTGISSRMGGDMQEKDVENAFLNEGFYTELGYKGAGYHPSSVKTHTSVV